MGPKHPHSRSGMTLLEVLLALTLLAIVAVKAQGTLQAVGGSINEETQEVALEDKARSLLRRIGYEIMGSNRSSLIPDAEAPMSTDDLFYRVNLGIQEGEVVWSDMEEVALEEERGQVFWSENPGEADERRVIWSSLVSPYLEGEIPNGMDDNGNGLIDEKGLSFVVQKNSVTIRLTLEKFTDGGESIIQTVETTVTCRNLESEE